MVFIPEERWFVYLNEIGTYCFKRYFSAEDITELRSVRRIFGPWRANTKEEAEMKLMDELCSVNSNKTVSLKVRGIK